MLYFYSASYMDGGRKMILELPDGFRPEVRFTHPVHVLSLQDESHPAYLLLLAAALPLDIATSPFQAVYYLIGFVAQGQMAH